MTTDPATPATDLARWIWNRFVGVPIAGDEYEKEFRVLLLKIAAYTEELKQREDFKAIHARWNAK